MSTSNTPAPTRGVPVDLGDGKERYLRFSLGVMRKITEKLGPDAFSSGKVMEHMAELLWCGLGSPTDLTAEQIEDMVDLTNIGVITEALAKATGRSTKDPLSPPPAAAESASPSA